MPGGCSCYGDSLFGAWSPCWEEGSVNEPCVQEVSGYDITTGWKISTWASLHEPSHTAHSYRYATMTHAPFSTRWCNEFGPHTNLLCEIKQECNTWWAWHFIQLAFVLYKKKKWKKAELILTQRALSLTGHNISIDLTIK